MSAQPYLSLIVPAYNEAGRIRSTLTEYNNYLSHQSYTYEIILWADGNDGTREIASELAKRDRRILVRGSAERGGKGRAVRLAVAEARGEVVGFVDADNKTPIDEMDRLLPWL